MKPLSTTNANLIMQGNPHVKIDIPTVQNTGDAVGVSDRRWVVAIVNNNTEKACADKLDKLGYEVYVPTQREIRKYSNGRRKIVDRVILPALLMLHVTEDERKEVVGLPYISRFMTDRAGAKDQFNHSPIATIPDKQIATLKFMLYNSDTPVAITAKPFNAGDKVRVARGALAGLDGEVLHLKGSTSELIVALNFFGCARLMIDTMDLEIIK